MPHEKSKLVYSTEKTVPRKDMHQAHFFQTIAPPSQQNVTVRTDRKGRGGKTVTIIEGLQMPQKNIAALLRQMKTKLGTGGTIKDTSLEIQGDHRDVVMATLKEMGFSPKRMGG